MGIHVYSLTPKMCQTRSGAAVLVHGSVLSRCLKMGMQVLETQKKYVKKTEQKTQSKT